MLRSGGRTPHGPARLVATLGVTDVARSAAFYARVIGLRIVAYTPTSATLAEPWRGHEVLRLIEVAWPGAPVGGRLRQLVFGFGADARVAEAVAQVRRGGADVLSHQTLARWSEVRTTDPDGFVVTLAVGPGEAEHALRTGPVRMAFGDSGLGGPIRLAGVHMGASDLERAARFWSEVTGSPVERRQGAAVLKLEDGAPGIVLHDDPGLTVSPRDVRSLLLAGTDAPTAVDPDGLSVGAPLMAAA